MKKEFFNYLLVLAIIICTNPLSGQVWFKLDLMEDGETYQISLVSEEDWSLPRNLTSTGQVTVKVPTLAFELTAFESVHPQLIWEYNSRIDSPDESYELDYLSFGLKNAGRDFEYEAGEEIPIIRFQNARGCIDYVSLFDNELDPLRATTTRSASLGNKLTVVGAKGNAYRGNQGAKVVQCKKVIRAKKEVMKEVVVYPNPASQEVRLKLDWTDRSQIGHFFIRDNAGRVVQHQKMEIQEGFNEFQFNITGLDGGIYHLELSNAQQESISVDRFTKIYSASLETLPAEEEEVEHKNPRN